MGRQTPDKQIGFEDVFGKAVADTTTNLLDIASHYPYSPERWRFFKNGTRQFIQYNSVPEYNHTGSRHELKPSGGDTLVLETAETPAYVVQYEMAASWTFTINQSLNTGDKMIVGLYDGNDGWYLEHNGGHNKDQCDLVMESGGSEVYRKTDQDLYTSVLNFFRVKLNTGWYDITRQLWKSSYVNAINEQENKVIGRGGAPSAQGPKIGNLPLRYEVQADAGTSGLALKAGSCANILYGAADRLTRKKVSQHIINIGSTGSWIPLLAVRIDPARSVTNASLNDINVAEFGGSGDVQLVARSHDPSKVLDSTDDELVDADYSTNNIHSPQNSVIQFSTSVDEAPDNSGTTVTSASNPGGFQVGYGSLYSTGKNDKKGTVQSSVNQKRPIYGRDTVVVWGQATATGDVTFELNIQQDW